MKTLLMLAFLLVAPIANLQADTQVYKCSKNGVTSFSQTPCDGRISESQNIKTYTPNAEDQKKAFKDNQVRQKEYDRLIKIRHAEEAKLDAQNRALAKQAAATRKRCDNLKMHIDWAKEDYRNAKPKNQAQAKTKLKRSEEVYALSCK
ncbi:DUF4124 domain-containing protein [Undibacterium sp. LX40W]|uniref:DUF4124 domain-containing protein n=1 Tax=Undibacterium nitidum TaxID=2762298 RepID=A0A923KJN9_9BURK|nr:MULTISPECIES: DUF4124 domain-containing protein [Undibacterium]MBC3879825.1 DUF4124 domain-containing protein [Undibacterium nitidum]MBC3891439.1 DUF4124 domain-containing protein [Undibacterium sp. LX40W]